jgi:hypothetical protein
MAGFADANKDVDCPWMDDTLKKDKAPHESAIKNAQQIIDSLN